MDVRNKRVLVVGLARSGLAVAHALARRGALVTVSDRKSPAEFREVLPLLLREKVGVELGSQRTETFLRSQLIVISPGVPWDLPQLQAARDQGIPVYPEVEAASWFLKGTLVGITGSNGKTTTTALLGDMLKASGFATFVGGNIGNALSSAVDHAPSGTTYVTELSSFQLEGIDKLRPHVAVMLNLSPNHLDRHPNLEAYSQAKRQIFRNQRQQDYAVLNADDPWVAGLRATVASRSVFFSRRRELPSGVFVSGGKIYYRLRHLERVLFETRDVKLRGDFNLEDVLAATAAACVLGADFTAIRKAVRAFQAVEHRLEFVREIAGVDFYNNSKATSVDATLKSLEAFEHGVHLIMGGKDKGAPYAPLLPLIKDRVREVLLIGAAAPVIYSQLAGSAELVRAGDLSTAVYEAFVRSRPGDTVLLAPACSSFDQFQDYEERGRVFKELVGRLANDVATNRVLRGMRFVADTPKPSGSAGALPGASRLPVPSTEPQASSAPTADSLTEKRRPPEPEIKAEGLREVSDSPDKEEGLPLPTAEGMGTTPGLPEGPQHMELKYVYEVDAVEMPAAESPGRPEEEPTISISEGRVETLDDDPLPYESRPKEKSGARGPKSEVRQLPSQDERPEAEAPGAGSGAQPSSKQPRLFEGSEQ